MARRLVERRLIDIGDRLGKRPDMAAWVDDRVLALSVGVVGRLMQDVRCVSSSSREVRVDVIDSDHDAVANRTVSRGSVVHRVGLVGVSSAPARLGDGYRCRRQLRVAHGARPPQGILASRTCALLAPESRGCLDVASSRTA